MKKTALHDNRGLIAHVIFKQSARRLGKNSPKVMPRTGHIQMFVYVTWRLNLTAFWTHLNKIRSNCCLPTCLSQHNAIRSPRSLIWRLIRPGRSIQELMVIGPIIWTVSEGFYWRADWGCFVSQRLSLLPSASCRASYTNRGPLLDTDKSPVLPRHFADKLLSVVNQFVYGDFPCLHHLGPQTTQSTCHTIIPLWRHCNNSPFRIQ